MLFFIVWLGCWLPIAIPLAIGVKWHPFKPLTLAQKLPLLSSLYLVAPFVIWGSAALTGETFAQLGLPWQAGLLRSLGLGLGAGVVGLGGMFVLQERWGWLKLATRPSAALSSSAVQTLLLMLLLGLWVGGIEEMVFRGFLFNQLRQDYPFWLAGAIASLIFALLHLVWEGSKNLPQLPGLWLMGMALILARNADGGNLGLAWGLHAGWVWTIASLDSLQAVTYKQRVPEWITGWGGQPLAGAIGIGFMAIVALLLWVIEA
ncbi:MAG: CPBP family intramembrane metalloprotease [Oscillatoriophycideae cyanobacterium NC_groundwater_1537_Pr4_S-0.65um_50_18]|nr:CPBP family intramembrane metalloprotease [Oscillatoriophycideae cyanobacterium NC_groundwater_1537_Pr4_S-0.65um_50_18]